MRMTNKINHPVFKPGVRVRYRADSEFTTKSPWDTNIPMFGSRCLNTEWVVVSVTSDRHPDGNIHSAVWIDGIVKGLPGGFRTCAPDYCLTILN